MLKFLTLLLPFALLAADPARVNLNLGSGSNDGTGDGLRTTFTKINTNVINLWAQAFTNNPASIEGKLNATNGTAVALTGSLTNVAIYGGTVIDTGDELQDTVDYSLALTPNGDTATSNDASARPRSVANLASLITDVDPLLVPTYARLSVLGYYSAGDGGGGDFRRVLASSGTTNAGTFFASTANALYAWERVPGQIVSVKMFGAKGDGETDDQPALQAALDHIVNNGGGALFVPRGVYRLDDTLAITPTATLKIPNGITISGEGFQSCLYRTNGSTPIFAANFYNNHPIYGANGIRNRVEHLTLRDLSFYGQTTGDAILLDSSNDAHLENLFIRTGGKGIHLKGVQMSRFQSITIGRSVATELRPGYVENTPPGGAIGGVNTYGVYQEWTTDDPYNDGGVTTGTNEENTWTGLGISNVTHDGIYSDHGIQNTYNGYSKGTGGYGIHMKNCLGESYDVFCEVNEGNDSDGAINGGGTTAIRMSGSLQNKMHVWAKTRNIWLTGGSQGNRFQGVVAENIKFSGSSFQNSFADSQIEGTIDQTEGGYDGQVWSNIRSDETASKEFAGNTGTDLNKGLLKYWDASGVKYYGPQRLVTLSGNYTVTTNDLFRIYSNLGVYSNVVVTLPAASAGLGPYTFTARQSGYTYSLRPNGSDAIGDAGAGADVVLNFNATTTLYATHSGRWIFQSYWGGQKMKIPSLSADPSSPEVSQIWYNNVTGYPKMTTGAGTLIFPPAGTIGNLPQGTDLSYSGTVIPVDFGSVLNNYRYRLFATNDATLAFTNAVRGITGSIIVAPAATNITLTLTTNALSPTGRTIVIPGGTTNRTRIEFKADYYPNTTTVVVDAWPVTMPDNAVVTSINSTALSYSGGTNITVTVPTTGAPHVVNTLATTADTYVTFSGSNAKATGELILSVSGGPHDLSFAGNVLKPATTTIPLSLTDGTWNLEWKQRSIGGTNFTVLNLLEYDTP